MWNKDTIAAEFSRLQDNICSALIRVDGKGIFNEERWQRPGGGGGRSRLMLNGNVIEKGGVNFSAVEGKLPETMMKALQVKKTDFFATGVSLVMHPFNPFVPVIHMNVRYFEISGETSWFGGGIDLTPAYINESDAMFFHTELKKTCDKFDTEYYPQFKKQADDYFFIPHRKETRGIGGIFFDKLIPGQDKPLNELVDFVLAVGNTFSPVYAELINRNREKEFTDANKNWQLQRRGRYVEFNLVYDKGTRFGLETDGRTESILMSLPPLASWPGDISPGMEEQKTLNLLKKDINWSEEKLRI